MIADKIKELNDKILSFIIYNRFDIIKYNDIPITKSSYISILVWDIKLNFTMFHEEKEVIQDDIQTTNIPFKLFDYNRKELYNIFLNKQNENRFKRK